MSMKRIIIALIVFMSMASHKALAYDIAVKNEDGVTIYYNYYNNGQELEVTYPPNGYGELETLKIPSEVIYSGRVRKVTAIGEEAFSTQLGRSCKLSCIYLPPTIKKVGSSAFTDYTHKSWHDNQYCGEIVLNKVVISDLKAFCEMGFSDGFSVLDSYTGGYDLYYKDENTLITDLVVPAGVSHLRGLGHCKSIKSLTTSSGVEVISDCMRCINLTKIDMQASNLSLIDKKAFYGCSKLKTIIFDKVKKISKGSFLKCSSDRFIILILKNLSAWCNADLSYDDIVMYNDVRPYDENDWKDWAFKLYSDENTEIKDLTIPNDVVQIRKGAFLDCKSINSIMIPFNVKTLGVINDSEYRSEAGVFQNCTNLERIYFANGVKSIGDYSFQGCKKLNNITWGANTEIIGRNSFDNCNLTSLSLPLKLKSIKIMAFSGNKYLKSVTIPSNVTELGYGIFGNCDSLMTVISLIFKSIPDAGTKGGNAFSRNTLMNATLFVPQSTSQTYKAKIGWKDFVWVEEGLPAGVESILSDEKTTEFSHYSIDGMRLASPQNGINIVRMSDGTTKKILVK